MFDRLPRHWGREKPKRDADPSGRASFGHVTGGIRYGGVALHGKTVICAFGCISTQNSSEIGRVGWRIAGRCDIALMEIKSEGYSENELSRLQAWHGLRWTMEKAIVR